MTTNGNLYIIAAPSGTGKTSLVKALIDTTKKIIVSISHTTRPKRPNEIDGVHYHFVSKELFENKIANQIFLEHAKIFDHLYGTSKDAVEDHLKAGIDVILEIDWQGNQQIKKNFPDAIGIFILPPSLSDLKERLVKRNQDHPNVIAKRLADVKDAVSHIQDFEYLIINDDFDQAVRELKMIIEVERLKQPCQSAHHQKLISDLQSLNPSES